MRADRLVATFLGAGLLRPAPGTWGSAAAIPPAYLLHGLGGPWLLVAGAALAFVAGWWAVGSMTAGSAEHDPSEAVIDEVVGVWIALLPVSFGLQAAGVDPWVFPWPGWLAAFVFFRVFDIWKVGLVGWADRLNSPLGTMLDDVIAGAMAAVMVALSAWLFHAVIAG